MFSKCYRCASRYASQMISCINSLLILTAGIIIASALGWFIMRVVGWIVGGAVDGAMQSF